ncbi:NucA/NucB deoxyribonuclease domain-containing protein [Nocardia brasiliensis]
MTSGPAATSPASPSSNAPASPVCAPDARSHAPDKWKPTNNPQPTVVPGRMRSDCQQIPDGFTKEQADKAETMEAALAAAPQQRAARVAEGCQVYWPAPYEVCGAIRDKYNELGGPNSFLLYPTSNELTNPDGVGKRSTFQNGPIYWSPAGGAHPVVNHFFAAWQRNGWEGGVLGYPTSDEIVNPDNLGRRQYFQGGTVYWKLNEAYYVAGAIRDKWGETGWEGGWLGYPTSDETGTPDGLGRFNRFEQGVIYWTGAYGARPVTGGLLDKWAKSGYERGPYGYPTGDQYQSGSSWYQEFQFGTMGWPVDPAAGVDASEPTVSGRPTTNAEFVADSAHAPTAPGPVVIGRAFETEPCTPERSCPDAGSAATVAARNNPAASDELVIPAWCAGISADGNWKVYRKEACARVYKVYRVNNRAGAKVAQVPYEVQSVILSSHRTGEMRQVFKLNFGAYEGNPGSPTFKYKPTYDGFPDSQYSVQGPASGASIGQNQTVTLAVTWKEHDMADYDIVARKMRIAWNFGNSSPDTTESTADSIVANIFRCDTTFKNTNGKLQQGCVASGYTPSLEMNSSASQNTGHAERAIQSGLPGAEGRPLHRQTDRATIDINRQTSCPRKGPIADARRVDGRTCDEYPFASTTEGAASTTGPGRTFNPECHIPDLGASNATTGFSVCMIDKIDNEEGGSQLWRFYSDNRVINQDPFHVRASGGALPPIP